MLVLSRYASETLIITAPDGTRISVMIVEIRGDKVRLGVTAPKTYTVHRSEIQAVIDSETRRHDSDTLPGIGEDYA